MCYARSVHTHGRLGGKVGLGHWTYYQLMTFFFFHFKIEFYINRNMKGYIIPHKCKHDINSLPNNFQPFCRHITFTKLCTSYSKQVRSKYTRCLFQFILNQLRGTSKAVYIASCSTWNRFTIVCFFRNSICIRPNAFTPS